MGLAIAANKDERKRFKHAPRDGGHRLRRQQKLRQGEVAFAIVSNIDFQWAFCSLRILESEMQLLVCFRCRLDGEYAFQSERRQFLGHAAVSNVELVRTVGGDPSPGTAGLA